MKARSAFWKAWESIGPMWSEPTKPSPERLLPSAAPDRTPRTRREDRILAIVRDEFTGYSLIGLVATRARLCFTGNSRINSGLFSGQRLSLNGPHSLNSVSQPRVPPHFDVDLLSFHPDRPLLRLAGFGQIL
jgi:hypothetical protein